MSNTANCAPTPCANPAPLGLVGFGMTTILINFSNVGLIEFGSHIIAMAIFLGGAAQIMTGVMEWRRGNTFGTLAFTAFGLYWLVFVATLLLEHSGISDSSSPEARATFSLLWGVFSGGLLLAALKLDRLTQLTFALVTALYLLLALFDLTANPAFQLGAGIVGLCAGGCAFYSGMAAVINDLHGRRFLPLP